MKSQEKTRFNVDFTQVIPPTVPGEYSGLIVEAETFQSKISSKPILKVKIEYGQNQHAWSYLGERMAEKILKDVDADIASKLVGIQVRFTIELDTLGDKVHPVVRKLVREDDPMVVLMYEFLRQKNG